MPQPTGLFCHTILSAKFNTLTSFSPHFLANIEGAYASDDFPVEQGYSVFPQKNVERPFYKSFSWQIGDKF